MSDNNKKPVLLCILDGFGFGNENDPSNAIARSDMSNFRNILKKYPHSRLETSGLAVGLPEGQIGNSEVGHMTIGAGRIIFQDLVKINKAIQSDELIKNKDIKNLISDLKNSDNSVHLCGLLSNGGVHSHQDHIFYLAKKLSQNNVKVKIHAFLDGRDVEQKSAIKFYHNYLSELLQFENIQLATVSGRYFAMDRDNRWERIKSSYDAIIKADDSYEKKYKNSEFEQLINDSYQQEIFDEFIKPCAFSEYEGAKNGDALIFTNFRADRARQISHALIDENFSEFARQKIEFSHKISMTSYSQDLDKIYKVLFKQEEIKNSLAEILEKKSKTQLRIAETEKYAHVTFFFSCGKEQKFKGEERVLVESPNVKTYDLKPEMSAQEVGQKLVNAIESKKYDFIVVNYANPDMVGHSGNLDAAIQACEIIDQQLWMLEQEIINCGGSMFITADHGNIERMRTDENQPHTSHTTNLVPFIYVSEDKTHYLHDGNLSDIAPTILDLMQIEKPQEMTGKSLFKTS